MFWVSITPKQPNPRRILSSRAIGSSLCNLLAKIILNLFIRSTISTLVGIFTGFYLSVTSAKTVVYKFQSNVDKGYKLLVHSIFKKELSNYYSLVELDDDVKDYGAKKYIVIHNNRNSGEDPDKDTIEKALRD